MSPRKSCAWCCGCATDRNVSGISPGSQTDAASEQNWRNFHHIGEPCVIEEMMQDTHIGRIALHRRPCDRAQWFPAVLLRECRSLQAHRQADMEERRIGKKRLQRQRGVGSNTAQRCREYDSVYLFFVCLSSETAHVRRCDVRRETWERTCR